MRAPHPLESTVRDIHEALVGMLAATTTQGTAEAKERVDAGLARIRAGAATPEGRTQEGLACTYRAMGALELASMVVEARGKRLGHDGDAS